MASQNSFKTRTRLHYVRNHYALPTLLAILWLSGTAIARG